MTLPCLPVTETTRRELADLLGLGAGFRCYETLGNLLLRGVRVGRDGIRPLLRPLALNEISLNAITGTEPLALYRHAEPSVTCLPSPANPSLWHEVLPYPFGLMLVPPLATARLEFFPPSWGEAWREVAGQFSALEAALARTEIGCLWLTSTGRPSRLLVVHHVRKVRTKAGFAPSLHELGEAYDRGELGGERLWQTFGTQVGFFSLDIPAISEGNHIISLSEAIAKTLELPHRSVEFKLVKDPLPDFQL